MLSSLGGAGGVRYLRPLFGGTFSCLGSASFSGIRSNGRRLSNSHLCMDIIDVFNGRGGSTTVRARGGCVSVRVPLLNIRGVN